MSNFKMIGNKLLNRLVFVENIIGVYRNFALFGRRCKILALLRIFFEIVLVSINFIVNFQIYRMHTEPGNNPLMIIVFHTQNLLSTTAIIILGTNCSNYKLFLNDFSVIYCSLEQNPMLTKFFKRLQTRFSVSTILNFIIIVALKILRIISKMYSDNLPYTLVTIFNSAAQVMIETRFILEHNIFSILIDTLRSFLLCLNKDISDIQTKYNIVESRLYSDRRQDKVILTVEQVEVFAVQYRRLMSCCKNLSACYGMQVGCKSYCLTGLLTKKNICLVRQTDFETNLNRCFFFHLVKK